MHKQSKNGCLQNKAETIYYIRQVGRLVFLGSITTGPECESLQAHWKNAQPALTYSTAITQHILSFGHTHAVVMYTQTTGTCFQMTCHNPNCGT